MDDWHEKLGNIFEMKQRKQLKGYQDVDLIDDVRNGRTGISAYKSAENGKNSYMYYTPVGVYNWELLIVVQEQVAFDSVLKLKNILLTLGITEALLFSLYFVWTIITVSQLEKSKQEVEEKKSAFEQLSYIDTLTNAYNRNKYNDMLERHENMGVNHFGIAFFDLNGLKQVNDEQGHKAGDILIQNTVSYISMVFPNLTYRIGGDEFVVLVPEISEQEFNEKVLEAQTLLEENKISISTGIVWRGQCDDLNEQIKEADSRMYEQKKLFYKSLSKPLD